MAIPGIAGEFHAGQEIDIDTDTNTVLERRLIPTIAQVAQEDTASDDTPSNAPIFVEPEPITTKNPKSKDTSQTEVS